MLNGLPSFQTSSRNVARSRRSMLETLVRHLDMVRLTVAAATILMFTACSGLIDDGGSGALTAEEVQARTLWTTKALPALQANCTVCHDGSRANIGFVVGADDLAKRQTILTYTPTVMNLEAPASSRLLTKGVHEGPQLDAAPAADLLAWLEAEKAAAGSTGEQAPLIEVARFFPKICTGGLPDSPTAPNPNCLFNIVTLDEIGIPGASIKFIVQSLGSGLYMTNLKLVPGAMGANIEHPLFVTWPADASGHTGCEKDSNDETFCADTIDRFFNVKMNLQGNATDIDQQIAGGTAAFVGFLASDPISIHFKTASIFVPDDDAGPVVGCKKLPEFKTNAAPQFTTNCRSCHGGTNANATSAMNLTQVNSTDDTMLLIACNEVYNRVNFTDTVNSGVYLAPDPANANHPFKFPNAGALTNFKTPVDIWVQAEKTAP